MLIWDVPALKVRFVVVVKVTPEERLNVLDPSAIVLTLELVDAKVPAVTAKLAVLNVPLVTVRLFVPMFNASAS